jgi:hypothetical protein
MTGGGEGGCSGVETQQTGQPRPGAARLGCFTDAAWRKATASQANDGCVEVAFLPGGRVGVRDSKDPCGQPLVFTQSEWSLFLADARVGELDRPS